MSITEITVLYQYTVDKLVRTICFEQLRSTFHSGM